MIGFAAFRWPQAYLWLDQPTIYTLHLLLTRRKIHYTGRTFKLAAEKWGFRKDFSIFVRTNLLLVLYGRLSCLARTLWFQQRVRTRVCVRVVVWLCSACECACVCVCSSVSVGGQRVLVCEWVSACFDGFFKKAAAASVAVVAFTSSNHSASQFWDSHSSIAPQRPFNLGILTFTN